MCEYSGFRDSMRFSQVVFSPVERARATKKFLGEPLEMIGQVGLAPFWAKNPAPEVKFQILLVPLFLCKGRKDFNLLF